MAERERERCTRKWSLSLGLLFLDRDFHGYGYGYWGCESVFTDFLCVFYFWSHGKKHGIVSEKTGSNYTHYTLIQVLRNKSSDRVDFIYIYPFFKKKKTTSYSSRVIGFFFFCLWQLGGKLKVKKKTHTNRRECEICILLALIGWHFIQSMLSTLVVTRGGNIERVGLWC